MRSPIPDGKILIEFDGMCVLCSRTIRFILKADRRKKFMFQTLQKTSEIKTFDSVIVTNGNNIYRHFDAILIIGKELGGIYRMVSVFRLIPKNWRHSLYLWISKNRYRWFGVRKSCYLPNEEAMKRFI